MGLPDIVRNTKVRIALILFTTLNMFYHTSCDMTFSLKETGKKVVVAGEVTDIIKKNSLLGTTVSIDDSLKSVTNIDGIYFIEDVPDGLRELRAYQDGYEPYLMMIEVYGYKDTNYCDIGMVPDSL